MKREADGEMGAPQKRSRRGDEEVRLLIPSKVAGSIIGKGGQNITKLRSQYKASITVPDCPGPERMLTLSSDLETICNIVNDVIPNLEENNAKTYNGNELDLRMLIHQSQAGCIIGRAGKNIKEIREKTGAHIKIFTNTAPRSSDRIIQIVGDSTKCIETIREVLTLIKTSPIRGIINPYDPHNYDEFYAEEYGGWGSIGNSKKNGTSGFERNSLRDGPPNISPVRIHNKISGSHVSGLDRSGSNTNRHSFGGNRSNGNSYDRNVWDGFNQRNNFNQPPPIMDQALHTISKSGSGGKNTTQVTIPKDLAGAIIGKGGGRIRKIRHDSGAGITIDEPLPGSNDRIITISGLPTQIQMAQYLLQQRHKTKFSMMKRLKGENSSYLKPHKLKLRRALFKDSTNEIDSDLGYIVPLNLELVDNITSVSKKNGTFLLDSINDDYDVLEVIQNNNTGINTTKENCKMNISECMSPLYLSPQKSFNEVSQSFITSTNNLKSLQELTNVTPTLPTSNSESSSLSLKRKLSKTSPSIVKKVAKVKDNTHSKVRTELFPIIDIALPTSNFYPKGNEKINKSEHKFNQIKPVSTISKPRQTKQKKSLGVINAGVRHNIKKPKRRRINKKNMKNLDIQDNYALQNYLMDIEKIAQPVKRFIQNKENCLIDLPFDDTSNQTDNRRPEYETFDDPDIIEDDLALNVNNIINSLEKKSGLEDSCSGNIILSPTTQMCNMASEMALCSPRKSKNLSSLLESTKQDNIPHVSKPKLFPVVSMKNISDFRNVHLDSDQMLLDAGQKRFGATQCDECELIFHVGEPSDENIHFKYHSAQPMRFSGWKDERIVGIYGESRIIKILSTDSKAWWKKAIEVMNYIDKGSKSHGNYEFDHLEQVYFYVKNKEIIGCLTAVPRNSAFKMISAVDEIIDLGSEETYPVKCGVSRLWISQEYRNIDIAKSLLQALKSTFIQGGILNNLEIAFNSSTDRRYFERNQFLIYS